MIKLGPSEPGATHIRKRAKIKLIVNARWTSNVICHPLKKKEPIYDVYCISRSQYQRFLHILFWGCISGADGSVSVWCSARRCCRGRGFESR